MKKRAVSPSGFFNLRVLIGVFIVLGGVFLAVSSLLIYGPLLTGNFQLNPFWIAGVALALLVAVLAFVNLAFGYCLGCQIYYQLGKRGLIRA